MITNRTVHNIFDNENENNALPMKSSLTETKECKIEKFGKHCEQQNDYDTNIISSGDFE